MFFTKHDRFITDTSDILVIIDPGHGGIVEDQYTTKGKMYDHGDFVFYEGVFNRLIALKYAHKLRTGGINYVFATTSNEDAALSLRTNKANNIANLYRNKDCIYLSLHGNAAGIEKASGIEVYTSPGETPADPIANLFYEELRELGWKMRKGKEGPDKEARFKVLMDTKMRALLLELGFFTNKEEATKMGNVFIQEKIADLLYKATQKTLLYLNQ